MKQDSLDDSNTLLQTESEPKKRHKCLTALIVGASILLGLFVLLIVSSFIFSDEIAENQRLESTAAAQALQDNQTVTAESWQVTREAISITQEAEIRQATREAISATHEAEIRQATMVAISATQESERRNRNAEKTAEAENAPTPSPTPSPEAGNRRQSAQQPSTRPPTPTRLPTPKLVSHTITSDNNMVGRKTIHLDTGRYTLSKTTGCIGAELAEYPSDDLVMHLLGSSSTSENIRSGTYILRALGNGCKVTLSN